MPIAGRNQPEPTLIDKREQVIDPMTAYQITSMMEGVVQRGTATTIREVGKPVAGKTGTTNDEKDAWFVGFSPDVAVGVYLGFDKPRSMGRGSTGGQLAAPVVRDFLKVALADKPAVPFRVPAGIKLIRIDPKSGMRAGPGSERVDPRSLQARHRAAGFAIRWSASRTARVAHRGRRWRSGAGCRAAAAAVDESVRAAVPAGPRRAALTRHVCSTFAIAHRSGPVAQQPVTGYMR